MQLFRLPQLAGVESMAYFHAAAELGVECVIITSPKRPIISTGYFDNAAKIIDMPEADRLGIPIFRRRLGGGTVLLDHNQVFYQIVIRRDNPMTPRTVAGAYRNFSRFPIEAFGRLGVEVEFRPVNDLVTRSTGCKISGQGAGAIEDCFVFVGDIIIDFDYDLMSRLFNVSDSKRGALKAALEDNLTSLTTQLGDNIPGRDEVEEALVRSFIEGFDGIEEGEPSPEVTQKAMELCVTMTLPEYVLEEQGRDHEKIKICEGVFFDRE